MKKILFAICLGLSYSAIAQTPTEKVIAKTNVEVLQKMSADFKTRALQEKQIATQKANRNNWPLRVDYKDGTSIELMALDETGRPMYLHTTNLIAAQTTNTDVLHSGGGLGLDLEGQNMIVGEWDAGAMRLTHVELLGRVTQIDGATTTHDHAQHVGGTMVGAGVNPNAKGMAPQAHLWAHDWGNDSGEMAAAAANGLLISQHSYGWITGWHQNSDTGDKYWYGDESIDLREDYNFGRYDGRARDWDAIAYNAPYYLICKSAGNDRGDHFSGSHFTFDSNGNWVNSTTSRDKDGGASGYDCIGHNGNSKNILSIGATYDAPNYTSPASVQITSFSSWGPTDDGRIKPDLVGNGAYVFSSSHAGDSIYSTKSGTSMSGPNVAGSLVLIQQQYRDLYNQFMKAATLKGLAIHTCRETGAAEGPDYIFGWGLLNTAAAVELLLNQQALVAENTLNNAQTFEKKFYHDGQTPIRATICWTDLPGTPTPAGLDIPTPVLVNDLDIRLTDPQGNVYFPYRLDPANPSAPATRGDNLVDNVEQIFQQGTSQGYYTLQVSHKGTLSSPQDFSLILEGEAPPPPVCLNLDSIWSENYTFVQSEGISIATDSLGGFYVAGQFEGNLQLDTLTISSAGTEIFIAKYNANKQPIWLKKISGNAANKTTQLVVDNNLAVYLTGHFTNTIDNQGNTFTNSNNTPSTYITKLDKDGQFVWHKELVGTSNQPTSIALANNQIFISGYFEGTVQVGTINLTSNGDTDAFVTAIDNAGNFTWANSYGGTLADAFNTLAITNNGNIWVGGHYADQAAFGNDTLFGFNQNAILVQLDNAGNVLQTYEVRGDSSESVVQIIRNTTENLLVAIEYVDNISINQQVTNAYQGKDIVLLNMTTDGTYAWQKHLHSTQTVSIGHGDYLDKHFYLPIQFSDSLLLDSIFISNTNAAGLLVWNEVGYFNQLITLNSSGSDAANAISIQNNAIHFTGTGGADFNYDGYPIYAESPGDYLVGIWEYDAIPFIDLGLDRTVSCIDTVQLSASIMGGGAFIWSPSLGLSDSTILNPSFVAQNTSTYQLQTQNSCGDIAIDNIIITVDALAGMTVVLPTDTTINCGDSLAVTPLVAGPGEKTYQWLPSIGVSQTDTLYPLISPSSPSLNYTLRVTNECGGMVSDVFRVNTLPPNLTASYMQDTSITCGDSIRLEVTASGFPAIRYNWIPSTGLSNPDSASTLASPDATTNYTLQILAGCNTDQIRTVVVNVNPINPTITINSDTLFANQLGNSYQWYENGQLIPAATDSIYVAVDSGDYYVIIADTNNCEGTSNTINYSPPLSIILIEDVKIELYPNPNKGQFELKLTNVLAQKMQIFNAAGIEVHQQIITNPLVRVNLPNLPVGVYWIKIISDKQTYTLPFVKKS